MKLEDMSEQEFLRLLATTFAGVIDATGWNPGAAIVRSKVDPVMEFTAMDIVAEAGRRIGVAEASVFADAEGGV